MNNASVGLSIVIPAFNEEKYIATTLDSIETARNYLRVRDDQEVEIIVVDNGSTDQTGQIARLRQATVIEEPRQNISIARNTGARAARGEILVFVDADTIVPAALLWRIVEVMSEPSCIGGAVDTEYKPVRFLTRAYLQSWRILGKLARMAQGATQFCRSDVFFLLGGYDEALYMGEDVDFYWRLRKAARKSGHALAFIEDLKVLPSCRRFDQWPFWKTLMWTNPVTVLLFRHWKGAWKGWYEAATR